MAKLIKINQIIEIPEWFEEWLKSFGYPNHDKGTLILWLSEAYNHSFYWQYALDEHNKLIDAGYELEEIRNFEDCGIEFSPKEWNYIKSNFKDLITVILFGNYKK